MVTQFKSLPYNHQGLNILSVLPYGILLVANVNPLVVIPNLPPHLAGLHIEDLALLIV